jgi:hypothetical protein
MTASPSSVTRTPSLPDVEVRAASFVTAGDATFCLADTPRGRRLLVEQPSPPNAAFPGFDGEAVQQTGRVLLLCPLSPCNAATLRRHLPWLRPQPVGRRTSAGMGDRLGLATPGHIRALRAAGGAIAPVLAQQSVRENTRTGRTPGQVLDDAMWGAFEEGWRDGYGADADHLKTTEDIDAFVAAGYTFFTIDPGALVNGDAGRLDGAGLRAALARLPWTELEDSQPLLWERLVGRRFDVEHHAIRFDDEALARAAVKYGAAIAEVAALFRHLAAARPRGDFDFEVSVDETDAPTSPLEHFYIARELQRLGIRCTSLAPRFPGSFEKGIDYRGSIDVFRAELAVHAAIAREMGGYKISLHSGSDKFSIYGVAAELTRGAVHLKTAGTSYLEALRTLATATPDLFRDIFRFALERYETDRASYHVSGSVDAARRFESAPDRDLPGALESVDARQVLHVTYGSVLNERGSRGELVFADRLFAALAEHRDTYAAMLQAHFVRHLAPFVAAAS